MEKEKEKKQEEEEKSWGQGLASEKETAAPRQAFKPSACDPSGSHDECSGAAAQAVWGLG